jgi:hypothetical protein
MAQQHEDLLKKFDIMYESKNQGVHLIVEGNVGYIDFWPSTGKWKERDSLTEGFGARTLVHHITTG